MQLVVLRRARHHAFENVGQIGLGSTPLSLQVLRSDARIAQVSPPPSSPQNRLFFFPIDIGRIERSTMFVSAPAARLPGTTLDPPTVRARSRSPQSESMPGYAVLRRFEPRLQGVHQRLRLGLPNRAALVGVETPYRSSIA